jgi:hypothetical protein
LANIAQAGSDVRSPNYWRESPNRWQSEQWQQSPVNNRNAPYRWDKEKWRQSPGNWRNKAYRKENEKYPNPSQDWRQKAYKWDKEKWSNNPNNWRNKAYRFDKKQWEQSPLNWQNSPYRWQHGDSADKNAPEGVDIKMNPNGATDAASQEGAPQTVTDTDESPGETAAPPEHSPRKGPRVVEVENGDRDTRDKYSSRVLPVIRVHGTTPSAATKSGKTFTERSTRPKHLNGFRVYGLQP